MRSFLASYINRVPRIYLRSAKLPASVASLVMLLAITLAPSTTHGSENTNAAAEIYRARVVPLIESPNRSSCSQCHLRGVELNDFISVDQAKTFSELRTRGWIDVDHPEKSKLLEFIQRGADDLDPLRKRVQEAEYAALKTWIFAAVSEPNLLNQPVKVDEDLKLPLDFIRHARNDQVLARFSEAIWSQLQRCAHCHSPERNQQQVKKHGEQMSWIVPQQPGATLALLTERKLIDIDEPDKSELRTKPLLLVKHGGGPKFSIDSLTDQQWRVFLADYAKLVRGGYTPKTPLPQPSLRRSWLSEMQLKLTDLPVEWQGRLLTVSLHGSKANGEWEEQAIAIGDGPIARKTRVWQAALTIFQPIESKEKSTDWSKPLIAHQVIEKGNYQVRVQLGRLVVSEELLPVEKGDASDQPILVATIEVEAPWPPGFQPPKIIKFSELKRSMFLQDH